MAAERTTDDAHDGITGEVRAGVRTSWSTTCTSQENQGYHVELKPEREHRAKIPGCIRTAVVKIMVGCPPGHVLRKGRRERLRT